MLLTPIAKRLRDALSTFSAPKPVVYTYHPLAYAWKPAKAYLERYGHAPKRALLVGMNPGPFGMAQTGVPFGDVTMVRDFLGIQERVQQPDDVHPARPIDGFACARSEVSGTRLWGWARDQFGDAEAFFAQYFVYNYCPLSFMEQSGRNVTPDKLPPATRAALFTPCDVALAQTIDALRVTMVVGIGGFATVRCKRAVTATGRDIPVATLLHPSPASPLANRGWAAQATATMRTLGLPVAPVPAQAKAVHRRHIAR